MRLYLSELFISRPDLEDEYQQTYYDHLFIFG